MTDPIDRKAEANLPSVEELAKLPHWALVAFANRCAQRMHPLLARGQKTNYFEPARDSIDLAEKVSTHVAESKRAAAESAEASLSAAQASDEASMKALGAHHKGTDEGRAAAPAEERSRAYAASAADFNRKAEGFLMTAIAEAYQCATAANDAAFACGVGAKAAAAGGMHRVEMEAVHEAAVRADFDFLRTVGTQEGWPEDKAMPLAFFGPLWPGGVPEGWPAQDKPSADSEIVLDIEVPEDIKDDELVEFAVGLAIRADDLHRAAGGHGLQVRDVEVFAEVPVAAGVLS